MANVGEAYGRLVHGRVLPGVRRERDGDLVADGVVGGCAVPPPHVLCDRLGPMWDLFAQYYRAVEASGVACRFVDGSGDGYHGVGSSGANVESVCVGSFDSERSEGIGKVGNTVNGEQTKVYMDDFDGQCRKGNVIGGMARGCARSVGCTGSGVRTGCDEQSAVDDGEGDNVVFRGKNWKKNQRKSANRKKREQSRGVDVDSGSRGVARCFEEVDYSGEVNANAGFQCGGRQVCEEKSSLRKSLEEKWCAENELKVAKARRELELLKAEDLDAVKKLRERKVQGATERTLVQIEKAHASLVQTGNVPGVRPVQQGFCQTVVDGEVVESVPELSDGESKGCSISPSSSISEREVREMKKELEDLRLENEKLRRVQKRMPLAFEVMQSQEAVPVSVVDGSIPESAREALDKVIGNGEWTFEGDLDMDPNTLYLRKEFFGFS